LGRGIEDRRLVLVDEADLRVAPVDIPGVADLLAEIRPGRGLLVAEDHVREQAIKIWNGQIVRDIFGGHWRRAFELARFSTIRRFRRPYDAINLNRANRT